MTQAGLALTSGLRLESKLDKLSITRSTGIAVFRPNLLPHLLQKVPELPNSPSESNLTALGPTLLQPHTV